MLSTHVIGASLDTAAERLVGAEAASRIVDELYARHATGLYGLARRLGLDEDEAWDAVQEAHVRLWHELTAGEMIRDGRAWLATATYRLAMDQHRLGRRLAELRRHLGAGLRVAPAPGADPTDVLAAWTAVDALPLRQRAAIHLHYRLDLTFEDVGRAMGISPGAARMAASRGLATVRAELGITAAGADA